MQLFIKDLGVYSISSNTFQNRYNIYTILVGLVSKIT